VMARFFFSSRSRHTTFSRDWSSDVCSSDLKCEGCHDAEKCCRTSDKTERAGRPDSSHGGGNLCSSASANVDPVVRTCAKLQRHKIGRASCRERVEIPGATADAHT